MSAEQILEARQERIDTLHAIQRERTALLVIDICVNCTLLSASTREYRVTAVTNAIATLWPNILEACFDIWKRKFARLRTTEEIIAELRKA